MNDRLGNLPVIEYIERTLVIKNTAFFKIFDLSIRVYILTSEEADNIVQHIHIIYENLRQFYIFK